MEQLDFFSVGFDEEHVFNILLSSLAKVLDEINADTSLLQCESGSSYSSVSFLRPDAYDSSKPHKADLAFRICCRKRRHYFGVSNSYTCVATPDIADHITTHGRSSGFTNYEFQPTRDGVLEFSAFLCSVLEMVIDSSVKEFDCCSRFDECSNLKRCTNLNTGLSIACGYRRKIKKNVIFYGENRNVD